MQYFQNSRNNESLSCPRCKRGRDIEQQKKIHPTEQDIVQALSLTQYNCW